MASFDWRRVPWLLGLVGLAGLLALIVACGGGVDSGGTGTGTYAAGPITGYGSIIVGGVRYDERAARVEDETGAERTPDDLKLGMLAEIDASGLTGPDAAPSATATTVRFRSELVGAVGVVDLLPGTLTVLGQTVQVTPTTVFDARLAGGLAAIRAGDVVEVYGQLDVAAGRYTATRIEPRLPATPFKLRGLVTAVNEVSTRLVIGAQTIDYRALASSARPAVGQLLRVVLNPVQAGGVWVATAIEPGVRRLPDRGLAEVEGRITAFTSIEAFEVDGVPVSTDASTSFPDGRAAVALGARVEARGTSSAGTLSAMRVEAKADGAEGTEPFEIKGTISRLDAAAQTFELRGFTVHWSAATRFEGGTASSLPNAREAEVKGALSSDGTRLEATRIKIER